MSLILGLMHHTHDAAAALVDNHSVLAAVEEERINRQKHTAAFPIGAIGSCLETARIPFSQIDAVAYPWQPWRRALYGTWFLGRYFPSSLRVLLRRGDGDVFSLLNLPGRLRDYARKQGWNSRFRKFHFIEHHMAHLAAAWFTSPFDRGIVISHDFCGEYHSQVVALGQGDRLQILFRQAYPHSLGFVFNAITKYLGFRRNCDEGKVMGLAPYGDTCYAEGFKSMVKLLPGGCFQLDTSWFDMFFYNLAQGGESELVSPRFIQKFGPPRKHDEPLEDRHRAIARGVQELLLYCQTHLVRTLRTQTGCGNFAMAGGVSLNACVNGELLTQGEVDSLHIPPAAGDAGAALGAALYVRRFRFGITERVSANPWLGPQFHPEVIRRALKTANLNWIEPRDYCHHVATALANGKTVAWFQGRMEFGPRALGSRSLLADPRAVETRDYLNREIKHRELFRPFAPAITIEALNNYFHARGDSPYMLKVFRATELAKEKIPAVVHVDGTARVQSVTKSDLPLFHQLLTSFAGLTGVPVLLNTSLNDRGEPIVATPDDAVQFFIKSPVDILAIGPCLVDRKPESGS